MSTKIVKGIEMKSCEDLCKEIDFKYPRSVMYDFINTMVKLNIIETTTVDRKYRNEYFYNISPWFESFISNHYDGKRCIRYGRRVVRRLYFDKYAIAILKRIYLGYQNNEYNDKNITDNIYKIIAYTATDFINVK